MRLPVRRVDLGTPSADPEHALRAAIRAELRARIDPADSPLRATLWRMADDDHLLCLNMHHLITDTWSCDVLCRDLAALYGALTAVGPPPPPVGWQYAQFVSWQQRQFGSEAFDRHRAYWTHRLAGLRAPDLPVATLPAGAAADRTSAHALIDERVGTRLGEAALTYRTTPFAVMLAVYYTLLHHMTGERDLAVATLFANRNRPELDRTVGFCTNMVVLRTLLPARCTFADVVKLSRTTLLEAFAHQEMPYHLLPRTGTGPAAVRVDDLVFQMLAGAIDLEIRVGDVVFEGVVPDVAGRFDLELALMPRGRGFAGKLYYTAGRVEPAWAEDFMAGYVAVAAAASAAPYAPIGSLSWSPADGAVAASGLTASGAP
jgi:hypothetical protein